MARQSEEASRKQIFLYGSSEALRSLIVSAMRDDKSHSMWKGRACALLGALCDVLVYLRDSDELIIDLDLIRDNLPLDKIIKFYHREDIPNAVKNRIKDYLYNLPGYSEIGSLAGNINQKCYEQHGYLLMEITEVLKDFS